MEWRLVDGYRDYEISTTGLCRNIASGKVLKPIPYRKGYVKYALYNQTVRKCYFAHRLVALAFIPNPNNKPQVNHIDGIHHNNTIDNLEWATGSENVKHAFKIGARSLVGSKNTAAKLDESQVRVIRSLLRDDGSRAKMMAIAAYFKVAFRTMERIKYRLNWKMVV